MEVNKMTKSNLERALEFIPSGNQMFPENDDLPVAYTKLRTIEKAYEELQTAGHDVNAQLKERRYQIAELICKCLSCDVENLVGFIQSREVDEGTIVDYFSNLSANTYIPRLAEALRRIVPNMDDAIREGAHSQEEYFPEED